MDDTLQNVKLIADKIANASTSDEIYKIISDSPLVKSPDYDQLDPEICEIKLDSQLRVWQELFLTLLTENRKLKFNFHDLSNWLCYEDIKLQALEAVKACFKSHPDVKKSIDDNTKVRLYNLLSNLPAPTKTRKTYFPLDQRTGLHRLVKYRKLQRTYSFVWLKFAKLKLPDTVFSQALVFIADNVMPNVSDPILFTDFFFTSYNLGAPFNILALNGLFVLIVKHNLDYPEFYKQVYGLLQSNIFNLPNREQFFKLLDLFLSSLHVPSYLVAAFIKRLSRLALTAPVDCILIILTLIKNWLIRHGNLECLINRISSVSNVEKDPFMMDELNPVMSNAIESSLWEIKTLQSHYFPDVARKAQFVDHRLQTVEDPLIQKTTDKILLKHMNKTVKDYPLAFVSPEGLFRTKDFDFSSCFVE